MTIDVHAHAIIPAALEEMRRGHPEYGPELVEDQGRTYLRYPGRERLGPLPPAIFDPQRRLVDMDRQRVALQVIAIPPPNFHYHIPSAVGRDFARIQNDHLLELSATQPDRFHLFATLPLQDVDASMQELERVAGKRRVRGVQIGTNIDGVDLDDPRFGPLWEALTSYNLPVWLHPDQRSIAGADRLASYYLQNLIGNPLESTIAMAKLIFGGVIKAHPELRFGFVHGGGFTPYQIGRWDHGWGCRPEPKVAVTDTPPGAFLRTFFFDSLTHDRLSLQLLGERVGWEQVLLGSDYPFDMASEDPVGEVEQVEMTPAERTAVLSANAQRFLRPER